MTIYRLAEIDTRPGAGNHPFTPPAEWSGGAEDYLALLRERYKAVDHGQRMAVTVLLSRRVHISITGPFAEQARDVLERLKRPATDAARAQAS